MLAVAISSYFAKECASADLSKLQKRCMVNTTWYEDGEQFDHWFKTSPCKFLCTCVVKKVKNFWVPSGSCVHSCPKFSYPPGCTPVSDGCCATSYVCPDGEKCQDQETGMLYEVGKTWALNSTCECECLGEGIGKYNCRCYKAVPVPSLEEDEKRNFESPCRPDDSQSCASCPIGSISCPIRAKCEKWHHEFEGIPMECTCYGNKGTRCVSKTREKLDEVDEKNSELIKTPVGQKVGVGADQEKQIKDKEARSRRSLHGQLAGVLYSEDMSRYVEKSTTRIDAGL